MEQTVASWSLFTQAPSREHALTSYDDTSPAALGPWCLALPCVTFRDLRERARGYRLPGCRSLRVNQTHSWHLTCGTWPWVMNRLCGSTFNVAHLIVDNVRSDFRQACLCSQTQCPLATACWAMLRVCRPCVWHTWASDDKPRPAALRPRAGCTSCITMVVLTPGCPVAPCLGTAYHTCCHHRSL